MLVKSSTGIRQSSKFTLSKRNAITKDVIIFVNAIRPATFAALEDYQQQTGRVFKPIVLIDESIHETISQRNGQSHIAGRCEVIRADFDSPQSLRKALEPFYKRVFAITSQYENSVLELKKLIPYFPHLSMPSEKSLEWSTEKKLMRDMLTSYNKLLAPIFAEALDASDKTIASLEAEMSYPLVVKPSGLEGSLLVTRVNNTEELRNTLVYTFNEIQKGYDTWVKRQKPAIVVEEFMAGEMYSIDAYVRSDGSCLFTPVVKVVTGSNIGFDDFFGYARITPAGLTSQEVLAAQITASAAVAALALRSTTAHVELMKTSNGWKVIELGPRIGGYRHDIYFESYGINHIMNDILNRAGELRNVQHRLKKHTAVFNIYAREEGVLKTVNGLVDICNLDSYVWHKQALQSGNELRFAKNNGDPVVELMFSNARQDKFDADVALMEELLDIQVDTKHK